MQQAEKKRKGLITLKPKIESSSNIKLQAFLSVLLYFSLCVAPYALFFFNQPIVLYVVCSTWST